MEESFLSIAIHHLIGTLTNPIVLLSLIIIIFGEYIPIIKTLLVGIKRKLNTFGNWFLNYENKLYENHSSEWMEERTTEIKINNFFVNIIIFTISTFITLILEIVWELGFRKATKQIEKSSLGIIVAEKIKNISPNMVLILFGVPFVLMEFVGIFAITAIIMGNIWLGIGLYIFKTAFFIPVHFILEKGKTNLLKVKWFELRYNLIVATLNWFKGSQTYVKIHNFLEYIKSFIRAIKNMISSRISLTKKAFEDGEVLSNECEKIRIEINEQLLKNGKIKPGMYKVFFNCINNHLNKEEKEDITIKN